MFEISSKYIKEEQVYEKDGIEVKIELEWGDGYVVVNDETFDLDFHKNKAFIVVSDYEQEDHSFMEGDGVIFTGQDDDACQEVEELFENNGYESIEDAGWVEKSTRVTMFAPTIEEV